MFRKPCEFTFITLNTLPINMAISPAPTHRRPLNITEYFLTATATHAAIPISPRFRIFKAPSMIGRAPRKVRAFYKTPVDGVRFPTEASGTWARLGRRTRWACMHLFMCRRILFPIPPFAFRLLGIPRRGLPRGLAFAFGPPCFCLGFGAASF